jgi:hypothetical protein
MTMNIVNNVTGLIGNTPLVRLHRISSRYRRHHRRQAGVL